MAVDLARTESVSIPIPTVAGQRRTLTVSVLIEGTQALPASPLNPGIRTYGYHCWAGLFDYAAIIPGLLLCVKSVSSMAPSC
jgi:hypothetical protein